MNVKYVFHLVWGGGNVALYNQERCYIMLRIGDGYSVTEKNGKEAARTLGDCELKTLIGRMLAKGGCELSAGSVGSKIPLFIPV